MKKSYLLAAATLSAIQARSLVMELKEWYGPAALMAVNDIQRMLSRESISGNEN